MVIAYTLSIHDDGTHMLGPHTYRVSRDAGYYDWRFGVDGVPHRATCPICGRKTDPDYVNPEFRVRRRKRDLVATYDGYTLVSTRFRRFCESHNWHQDVEFSALPADDSYFVFKPSRILQFDAERRKTRFENHCPACKHFFNVIGATPVFLLNLKDPVSEGFWRTDLEFASGHEQHPLLIVGIDTAQAIEREAFQLIELEPVHR